MTLVDGFLNVWVFGPGYGEFIVVHVPPHGWLAVDGCVAADESWPQRFFEEQSVLPTHILLTHPHQDHAAGLVELIDDATLGSPASWPLLGVLEPPLRLPAVPNVEAGFHGQDADGVLSAMRTRWQQQPQTRWNLTPGVSRALGSGVATVLSPVGMTGGDPNERSTALEIEWEGTRVVLGADLVESPGKGWSRVLAARSSARSHVGLKVPHHGSPKALHPPLLQRLANESPSLPVLTPYSKGLKLPHFDASSGVAMLLEHSPQVLLTALPQRYSLQSRNPRRFALSELAAGHRPVSDAERVGAFPSCWVHLVFAPGGQLRSSDTTGLTITR
jgi:hypothetical protein